MPSMWPLIRSLRSLFIVGIAVIGAPWAHGVALDPGDTPPALAYAAGAILVATWALAWFGALHVLLAFDRRDRARQR